MLLIAVPLGVAFLALLVIFRHDRLSRAAGEPSYVHPFRLRIYRGCAVLAFLFFVYVAVMLVLGFVAPRTYT
jgi:hypothetical protein